jgi:chromatin segregation and condensation protein Rec8/ScpA/Scc1 (kleisin family)
LQVQNERDAEAQARLDAYKDDKIARKNYEKLKNKLLDNFSASKEEGKTAEREDGPVNA